MSRRVSEIAAASAAVVALVVACSSSESPPDNLPPLHGNRGSAADIVALRYAIPQLLGADRCLAKDPSPAGTERDKLTSFLAAAKTDLPAAVALVWTARRASERTAVAADQLDRVGEGLAIRYRSCRFDVSDWIAVQVDGDYAVANFRGDLRLCGVTNDSTSFSAEIDGDGCTGGGRDWHHVNLERFAGDWRLDSDDTYCKPCG